jgi:ATP-binding cassette, subfamily B, bacterial PglK
MIKKIIPSASKIVFSIIDKPAKRQFWVVVILAIITSLLESANVIVVMQFLDIVADPDKINNIDPKWRPDFLLKENALPLIFIVGSLVLATTFLFKNLVLMGTLYVRNKFINELSAQIAIRLYRKYLMAPFYQIYLRNSADLINRVFLASNIPGRSLSPIIDIITECALVGGILIVLFVAEPAVTLASIVFLAILGSSFHFLVSKMYRKWGDQKVVLSESALLHTQEGLGGFKEIRILKREESIVDRFCIVRREQSRLDKKIQTLNAVPRLINETIVIWVIAFVVIAIFLSGRPTQDYITVLGLFAFAGFRMMPSINRFMLSMASLNLGRAGVERVCQDIAELDEVEFDDAPHIHTDDPIQFESELEVKNVSFTYPGADKPVLRDVSFSIRPGESIGIVGMSGSGKTTLINILLGLFEPSGGALSIDGISPTTRSRAWCDLFAYVPQDIFLLDDSLRRNIALGLQEDDIDDRKIILAADQASLESVIASLDDGLETIISEHGSRLSGGQRQRIGIARALYQNPQILILDEATAALDSETERDVMKTLDGVRGEKTVIMIAHRLSSVQNCDRVIFMKSGYIADIGTFDELCARNDDFSRMVSISQISSNGEKTTLSTS